MNRNQTTTQITQVNGLEIVAREPALGPHPRWPERTAAFGGIEKVLLADGSETYICLDCGATGDSTRSVVSHRNGAHIRKTHQRYSEATIRALMREVGRARRGGKLRGTNQTAADSLNAAGITTVSGQPWTADSVSHVYQQYRGKIRVRIAAEQPSPNGQQPRVTAAFRDHPVKDDGLTVQQEILVLAALMEQTLEAFRQLAVKVEELAKRKDVDPEIAEKAKRFDQIQTAFRS